MENLARGLMGEEYTSDWQEIITLISIGHNNLKSFMLRYMFQASIHGLWLERNGRRHGEASLSPNVMIRKIDRNIRNIRNRYITIQRVGDRRWEGVLQYWFTVRPDY